MSARGWLNWVCLVAIEACVVLGALVDWRFLLVGLAGSTGYLVKT